MRRILSAFIIAALALTALPVRAADAPFGVWLTEKGKVAVELFDCDGAMCGQVVWLDKPRYRSGELKIDRENPDPALRDRPWCGIQVIRGLRQNGDGDWEGGKFYYPKEGATFDIEIEPRRNGTLKVSAFLGIKILGKTETWSRADGPLPSCEEIIGES